MKPTTASELKVVICLLAWCSMLSAIEHCDIVAHSDAIVRGRLVERRLDSLPDGGFAIVGKITVAETLYGAEVTTKRIPYLFRCPGCPAPDLGSLTDDGGVWGLKRNGRLWVSAGRSTGDPGWRPLSALKGLKECFDLDLKR